MTKGLQALKELKKRYGKNFSMQDDERTHIIAEELKEYEKIKDIRITARFDLDQVNKEHKALEIIKSKGIDVDALKYYKDLEHYNFSLRGRFEHLTQEEYELLKEVLI